MNIHVERSDMDGEMAIFQADAPPRVGDYLWFDDDGEAIFKVRRVTYDMRRFGRNKQPDVIVLVAPASEREASFHFDISWQDATERPNWLPGSVIIESDYVPRVGEMITIGLVEPQLIADTLSHKSDGAVPADRLVDVEIVAVAHGSFLQQTDEDRDYGIGFADLQSELQVRKATRGAHGDIQRLLARTRQN